jgi:hypothetical protein
MPRPQPSAAPDIAEVFARLLERVAAPERPLLVALAERLAAERYRGWSQDAEQPAHAERLLACAAREEEIAARVESLHPDAAAVQREILAKHPDLLEINRTLFAQRPLREQFAMQAQGERLGAATWRALARKADDAAARRAFLACAELEEASARVLEEILAASDPGVPPARTS